MRLFPSNNIWNTAVDTLPVLANSATLISAMTAKASTFLRCDDVMPLNLCQNPPLLSIGGIQPPQSDPGSYGVPASPVVESGSDHHCLVIDTAGNMLYEFYAFSGSGPYSAGSAAKWDLSSNALRAIDPSSGETTSADAAGLPISAGVVQFAEITAGTITHCLRMTST